MITNKMFKHGHDLYRIGMRKNRSRGTHIQQTHIERALIEEIR